MGISRRLSAIVGILFCSISLISFCTIAVSAATLHVPEEYSTIQSAIDAAVDFDTVLINDGTYTGDGNRDIDYHGKAIVVTSVNGAASTIIDCQADSTNPHRGFIFHSGEDSLSILQGLTIQGGFAPGNLDSGQSNGGGILCDSSSSPTIMACKVTQCRALNTGGGIAIFSSSPKIINCGIFSNIALNYSWSVIVGLGGGVYCNQSNSKLISCDIDSNQSNVGGGLACKYSNTTFDSSKIRCNIAEMYGGFEPLGAGFGGGVYLFQGLPQLNNCEITGNVAKTFFGVIYEDAKGGGVFCYQTNSLITNCTIAKNIAEGWPNFFSGTGGGIFCHTSNIILNHCVIAFNENAESIYLHSSATISIDCTDIFGNEFGDWITTFDTLQDKNNNISADPQFCDLTSGDYEVSQLSPCLEAQSPCGERIGVYGMGCLATDVNETPKSELPSTFILYQNHPNPFNLVTTINFDSPTSSPYQLKIYNILGEVVHQVSGISVLGINTLIWNADKVASGIYFYSLKLGENSLTRKMLLLK